MVSTVGISIYTVCPIETRNASRFARLDAESRRGRLPALPFTTAVAARQSFDLLDNFATRCEPEGMPRLMFNPHRFELIGRGETLALRAELYDEERTIARLSRSSSVSR
jgi:hypothetical protein